MRQLLISLLPKPRGTKVGSFHFPRLALTISLTWAWASHPLSRGRREPTLQVFTLHRVEGDLECQGYWPPRASGKARCLVPSARGSRCTTLCARHCGAGTEGCRSLPLTYLPSPTRSMLSSSSSIILELRKLLIIVCDN